MQNMIVTIRNREGSFQYDIEIPTDLNGEKLTDDVMEALNGLRPELCYSPMHHGLFLNRLGRFLQKDETMAQSGIRNGDYITIEAIQR